MDKEEIRKKHSGALGTLWDIYQSDGKFYKNSYFLFSLVLTVLLVFIGSFSESNYYDTMQFVANSAVNILPNLLGFSLGAYILVVGFGSSDILLVITRPLRGQKNYSLYQKLNAVFGITVIFEIATLLLSVVIIYLDKVSAIINVETEWFQRLLIITNFVTLFTVTFGFVYSILMLINITKQVFIFAQTIHLCISLNHSKAENKDDLKNIKDDDCEQNSDDKTSQL